MPEKTYIGDGVYAMFDGNGIWLTTENGIEVTNTIYLERFVYDNIKQYTEKVFA